MLTVFAQLVQVGFVAMFGHDTGEKIIELTCTQQLQKWQRRTKKGSIPMIPLKDIKVRSA